jgi:probable HAF family extracellular repeat protein
MEGHMKFHVVPCLLAASALSACAQSGGSSLPGTQSAAAPAQSNPTTSSSYTVVSLAPLGGSSSGANSINNRNWASGVSSLSSSSYIHAALWENGGAPTDLGTLGGPNSAVEWPVKNDHGLISGIAETSAAQHLGEVWSCAEAFFPQPPSGHICRGFAWQNQRMSKLPTLGGNNGFAAGANNHGEIVGWAETRKHDSTCTSPQVLGFEAVIYEPWGRRKIQELRPYHGDKDGAATEINDRDQAVGISGACDQAVGRFTAKHAVMWDHGKIVNLGSLGGVAWNTPMAINEHGDVVGFADLPGDQNGTPNPVAFLWTKNGGMQNLGTLPGDTNSEAYGINDLGQVVGESFTTSSARAFIWQNGTMTDLNTLIPPSAGLYLFYANDINDSGAIAGGACALVSGACGSEFPGYMATPMQGAGRSAPRAVVKQQLPEALRRLLRFRGLVP